MMTGGHRDPSEKRPMMKRALTGLLVILLFFGGSILTAVKADPESEISDALDRFAELYEQGRYDDALSVAENALKLSERELGTDHLTTATALNELAVVYVALGRYDEAEPVYKRSLAIREESLGPDDPDVALSLNNLAQLYRAQRRYTEAEPLYKRALEIEEKALSPEDPDVATTLDTLAGLYHLQGRFAEAEPLYQRALAIRTSSGSPFSLTINLSSIM